MSVILVLMVTVCDTVGTSLGNKKATSESAGGLTPNGYGASTGLRLVWSLD